MTLVVVWAMAYMFASTLQVNVSHAVNLKMHCPATGHCSKSYLPHFLPAPIFSSALCKVVTVARQTAECCILCSAEL